MRNIPEPQFLTQRQTVKRQQRRYNVVSDEQRHALINLLLTENGLSLKKASEKVGIPYNNAKVIFRIYRKEGRIKGTPKHLKRAVARIKENRAGFVGYEGH